MTGGIDMKLEATTKSTSGKSAVLLVAIAATMLSHGYDWSQHTAGSSVTLPAGDTEVSDAEYPMVAALGSILLSVPESRIVFNLEDDHSASPLGCTITGWGTIVKNGEGVLQFGAPHTTIKVSNEGWYDYFTTNGIALNGGTLKFPQNAGAGHRCGHLTMAEGTTLYTANDGESIVESLNGYGLVTNTATAKQMLRIGNSPGTTAKSVFHGTATGRFLSLRTDGFVELLNTENTFGENIQIVRNADGYSKTNRGITAVMKLGQTGEPSSVGVSAAIQMRYGSTLRYLGTGETCNKRLFMFAVAKTPNVLDAGTTGDIHWTGDFYFTSEADGRFVLTGDNTKECVWSGPAVLAYQDWTCYMAKEGSGTWRLANNASRINSGAWAIREGTLKFDSLAEKGEVCALGLSTNLYTDVYCTSRAKRVAVDYAILLGSDKDYPTLEFSGAGIGVSTNRLLRLTGTGGTLANTSPTGTISINGIAAEDEGAKKLTLAGTNATGNIAGNISDGAGVVSVEKTGSGTWRLEGDQTFSGSLDVKDGMLVVAEKPTHHGYGYYKLTVEQTYKKDQYLWIRRIALYDKDGVRVGGSFTEDAPVADETDGSWTTKWHFEGELQPGHARWDVPSKFIYYTGNTPAHSLNENDTPLRSAVSGNLATNAPNRWMSVVWRMPEGANPVAAVDIVQHVWTNTTGRVGIFSLYGSGDGINWHKLKRVDLMENTIEAGRWASDGCTVTNNAVRPGAGFALDKIGQSALPADVTYDILQSVSGVSVSPGATLKAEGQVTLPAITVDCTAGNGTIDGFDFASNGVVNLVNLAGDGTVEVPFTFTNLPAGALDRLNAKRAWSVTINGSRSASRIVKFTGSSVGINPVGTVLHFR